MTYKQVNDEEGPNEMLLCTDRELEDGGFSVADIAETPEMRTESVGVPEQGSDTCGGDLLNRLAASPPHPIDSRLSRRSKALAEFVEEWPIDRFERMLELVDVLDLTQHRWPCDPCTALA
jgi:hypothetical protein